MPIPRKAKRFIDVDILFSLWKSGFFTFGDLPVLRRFELFKLKRLGEEIDDR